MIPRPKTVFEKVSERMMNAFGRDRCPVCGGKVKHEYFHRRFSSGTAHLGFASGVRSAGMSRLSGVGVEFDQSDRKGALSAPCMWCKGMMLGHKNNEKKKG